MSYCVRPMQANDIPGLILIDREAFSPQWPPTPFRRELSNSMACYLVAIPDQDGELSEVAPESPQPQADRTIRRIVSKVGSLVGVHHPQRNVTSKNVVGYIAFWMLADEAHITSIAVRQAYRQQGIGELLLISAIDLADTKGASVITLEVRASNLAAQALYAKYGFARVGERRAYYLDNREDAVIMTTDPVASPSYQSRLHQLKQAFMHQRQGILAGTLKNRLMESRTS